MATSGSGNGNQKGTKQEPPRTLPQTNPPPATSDHSFTLQAIMELQKSMGSLEKAVEQLASSIENQSKSIDRIKYILAFSAGVVFIGSIILGYIVDKKFDNFLEILSN